MKSLAILGAGGHGKVVADAARAAGWERIVFFDQSWTECRMNGHWPVIGDADSFYEKCSSYEGAIVAIGNCQTRHRESVRTRAAGGSLPIIIHPRSTISPFAKVDAGVVILAGAVINFGAHIGFASIVNVGSTVDHDCVIAEGVHIAPGVNICGGVSVGSRSWIGVGASIRQDLKIGMNVIVGAGAVVVNNIGDDVTVIGNPAKPIKKA